MSYDTSMTTTIAMKILNCCVVFYYDIDVLRL